VTDPHVPVDARPGGRTRALWIGLAVAALLVAAAVIIPGVTGWNVHVRWFPPLHAEWMPRLGPGTVPSIALAVLAIAYAGRVAATWAWGRLLALVYLFGVLWMVSLATVDGWDGIGAILEHRYEYLGTAREVTDFGATLREYVSRIPFDHPDNWPVHIAGHPPGALLVFVVMVRLGLGTGLAAGWVVLLIGATAAVAVLSAMRRLGAERHARRAAPFLVFGPAAIWFAVSADGMFAAVAAWGLCLLAFAATARGWRVAAWGVAAGTALGYCVMMSYGLPLLGVLAVAVLVIARSWHPLPWAVAAALAVVIAFAVAGFAWWEALPVLTQRYWDGVASSRPAAYWMWGNLAALTCSAGLWVGPSVAAALTRWRRARPVASDDPGRAEQVAVMLVLAALLTVLLADLSQMSKAEVERIWLPFVPWLLVGTSLLPDRWRTTGLGVQVTFALVIQHVLVTSW
jgi:hypothetical protein